MGIEITNVDQGSVIVDRETFEDETFTAAAAKTYPAGTILARDTATNKMVVYEKGGTTNGNGIPRAILPSDVVATGAGDLGVRPLMGGRVKTSRLVIDADGDASNVDAVVKDLLQDVGIFALDADDLSVLDNQ